MLISDILQYPRVLKGKPFNKDDLPKLHQGLTFVNEFIKKTGFVAETEYPTVADFAFLASYSTMRV